MAVRGDGEIRGGQAPRAPSGAAALWRTGQERRKTRSNPYGSRGSYVGWPAGVFPVPGVPMSMAHGPSTYKGVGVGARPTYCVQYSVRSPPELDTEDESPGKLARSGTLAWRWRFLGFPSPAFLGSNCVHH